MKVYRMPELDFRQHRLLWALLGASSKYWDVYSPWILPNSHTTKNFRSLGKVAVLHFTQSCWLPAWRGPELSTSKISLSGDKWGSEKRGGFRLVPITAILYGSLISGKLLFRSSDSGLLEEAPSLGQTLHRWSWHLPLLGPLSEDVKWTQQVEQEGSEWPASACSEQAKKDGGLVSELPGAAELADVWLCSRRQSRRNLIQWLQGLCSLCFLLAVLPHEA